MIIQSIKRGMQRIASLSLKALKVSWPTLIAIVPLTVFLVPQANATTISDIAVNTGKSMGNIASLLETVSLIAGIGLIMAAFFKFHQHKLNPQQVPISQGITLLLVGAGLTLFPELLPVGGKAIVGSGATFGSLTDTTGSEIINSLKGTGPGPSPK